MEEAFSTGQNRAAQWRKLFSPNKTALLDGESFFHRTKLRCVAEEAFFTEQNRAP